jgi:hypothetical protein
LATKASANTVQPLENAANLLARPVVLVPTGNGTQVPVQYTWRDAC